MEKNKKLSKILYFFFLICTLAFAVLTMPMSALIKSSADEQTDYLPESYSVEIQETEIKFPAPNIPSTWAYNITLKGNDGEIIAQNVNGYKFNEVGNYTLVYTIYKNGSLSDYFEESVLFKIVDTVKPVLTTEGYDEEYFVGTKLTILTPIVTDNVDTDLTATITLMLGEVEQTIVDDEFEIKEVGEYTLIYKATDLSGNEGVLIYKFTALAKSTTTNSSEQNGCAGCSGQISFGAIGGVALVGICAGAILMRKNKKDIK